VKTRGVTEEGEKERKHQSGGAACGENKDGMAASGENERRKPRSMHQHRVGMKAGRKLEEN